MMNVWKYYRKSNKYREWIKNAIINEAVLEADPYNDDYRVIRRINNFLQDNSRIWEDYREYADDDEFLVDVFQAIIHHAKETNKYQELHMEISKVI